MNMSRQSGWLLVGLAAIGIALWSPSSGWLARAQWNALIHPAPSLMLSCDAIDDAFKDQAKEIERQNTPILAANPNDAELQRAGAQRYEAAQTIAALRPLAVRFPGAAAIRADLLRFGVNEQASCGSRLENYMGSTLPENWKRVVPAPDAVAKLLADADAGERLEPGNAYFPAMASAVLFAADRDDEALAALHRAAQKPDWDEHIVDSVQAKWRLAQLRQGHAAALSFAAIWEVEQIPHLAQLRGVARIVVQKAITREVAGDKVGGFACRRDLMALALHLKNNSRLHLGNVAGYTLCAVSTARPGGAPSIRADDIRRADESAEDARLRVQKMREEAWAAYAIQIGHPEAAQTAATNEAGRRALQERGPISLENGPFGWRPEMRLMWLESGGVALLVFAPVVLFWGIVFWALSRSRRVQDTRPMHPGVRAGLWLASINGPLVVLAVNLYGDSAMCERLACWILAAISIPCFVLPLARRRDIRLRHSMFALLYTTLALLAAVSVQLYVFNRGMRGDLPHLDFQSANGGIEFGAIETNMAVGAASMALPLLIWAVLALVGWKKRVPASVYVVRTFPRIAIPLLALQLVGWAALSVVAARADEKLRVEMERYQSHEGRAMAALVGKSWPIEGK